ncbi:MAG: hypothetical protein Q4D98_07210 [Planctomycetia bacterium]|nr:hypothetical protein [Planctomycetia bacterium]
MSPSFPQKAVHYTRALARWIKAGRPVRSEAEILHLLNDFCLPCESYDPQSSTCLHCGCHVSTSTSATVNKLAMGTERCPVGKW